jgi:ribosomal protein S18 acetylase RimI-like enzyme
MTGNRCRNMVKDHWLSDIFGYDVYRLVVDDAFIESNGAKLTEEIPGKPVFIYAKVPVRSLHYVGFLEGLGFRLVDTNIVFEKQVSKVGDVTGNCVVRFAQEGDQEQVTELAGSNFECSRFHLDAFIPDEIANEIKSQWARNFFVGERGEQMVVAVIEDKVVGFAQLLFGENKNLVIDLIAVDRDQRRKGIAKDMITYAEENCQSLEKIRVGTQLANTASVKLYEKLGFRMAGASYILHYHGVR